MKYVMFIIALFSMATGFTNASSECDIKGFYEGSEPASGTMVLTGNDELEEAELVLYPTKLKTGKFTVKVTRKAKDLYKVEGLNLYIETMFCYEYSYSEEVALIIDSEYGYTKGKIIF